MNHLKELNAQNLALVDHGNLSVALNKTIRGLIMDCENRCTDNRKRKIKLELELVPVTQERDNTFYCENIELTWNISGLAPNYQSKVDVGVRAGGIGAFAPDSPQNHLQGTLLEMENEV